ncbi:hypothetical protein bcgnr5390_12270 [Bacillus luti]|nr:hypothetical protein BC2903_50950 [Bacillus cereus]
MKLFEKIKEIKRNLVVKEEREKALLQEVIGKALRNTTELKKLGDAFKQEVWKVLDYDSKAAKVNEFVNGMSKLLGIRVAPKVDLLLIVALNKLGSYNRKNNVITLNAVHMGNGEDVAEVLVHEMAHAYQNKLIKDVKGLEYIQEGFYYLSPVVKEKNMLWVNPLNLPVRVWDEEFKVNQNKLPFDEYIGQQIEIHANKTALDFTRVMFGRKTDRQARMCVGYRGEHGFGKLIETPHGEGVVLEEDVYGNKIVGIGKGSNCEFFIFEENGDISGSIHDFVYAFDFFIERSKK